MEISFSRLAVALRRPGALARAPGWAGLTGALVLAVYLALIPYVARAWRATGDEPHYLLAAHSLARDGDFDLADNYDRRDYLDFYISRDLDRQIRLNRAGQQILNHQLGLPVLIAPAYALAGRTGVLVFQALLGGLLAGVTFKLAAVASGDERAAWPAALFVALSPPLLMYPYLVYPELIAALLATSVLYLLISRDRPGAGAALVVYGSLLALPWLNRRFGPLAILLALLAAWSWRRRGSWRGLATGAGASSLLLTLASLAALAWFTAQLQEPARIDITAPDNSALLWHRLGRGIGWLLDQQRGLFVFAPIYIAALWGLPPLLQRSLARRSREWLVLLPFLLSLGVTALAGGYWVAWELGPRFLVVGLPPLGAVLAVAWRSYGRTLPGAALILALFAASLANSAAILKNPALPYESSLPLYYAERWNLPLPELLPSLSGYARVSPDLAAPAQAKVLTEAGSPVWFAEAGRPAQVVDSGPLPRLPYGPYRLLWAVRTDPNLPPETELLRLSANLLGGGQVFFKTVTAAELPADGGYGRLDYRFLNTNANRWQKPLVLHAVSTGQGNIWAQDVVFQPNPVYAWLLPYLTLGLLLGGALLAWARSGRAGVERPPRPGPSAPGWARWAGFLLPPLAAAGFLALQIDRPARTYDAGQFYHLAGQPVADPAAADGRAWLVDPATDPPQKATYGPFDIYDAGRYRVSFRIKLPEAVETGQTIALLQVNATANFDELVTQPLRAGHFARPDLYHDFVLTVDNPRRQALSFDVHYLGLAPLVIDQITITEVEEAR
ncbi:MAG: hypothetical protein ACE5H9_11200 [Anaerolineae bacterium]